MKRIIILSVIATIFIQSLYANTAIHIKGQVVDNNNKGIAYATVALVKDSIYVKVDTTDSLGMFEMEVIPCDYLLQIRHISYQSVEHVIKIGSNIGYIGVFKMDDSVTGIKEVVVTATSVSREADRFVMRITNAQALAGKDGTDILAQAPGVWLDDSGVAINGMKGTKVYINERELKLTGDNLISYLRGLNSSNISKIEIIPQAGAEYSADSRGGIVKITLRKQLDNGLNGSLQLSTVQGESLGNYAPLGNIYKSRKIEC